MNILRSRPPANVIGIALLVGTLFAAPASVPAQSYRYMDESGNIYFVDRLQDVPRKYRYQIVGTPTPEVIDKKHPKPKPTKEPKEKKKKKKKKEKRVEVKSNYPSFFSKQPKGAGGEPPPMPDIAMPTPQAGTQDLDKNDSGMGSKPKENSTSLPSLKR